MSQYFEPIEAETVLFTLWERLEHIQPTKLYIKKIKDIPLSTKRAAAIARYAVRVIAPEILNVIGKPDEAKKLRNLPADVDLIHARRVICDVYYIVNADNMAAGSAVNVAYHAAYHASNDAKDCDVLSRSFFLTTDCAASTALYADCAASTISKATSKHRHVYHLNQMIQVCLKT